MNAVHTVQQFCSLSRALTKVDHGRILLVGKPSEVVPTPVLAGGSRRGALPDGFPF